MVRGYIQLPGRQAHTLDFWITIVAFVFVLLTCFSQGSVNS